MSKIKKNEFFAIAYEQIPRLLGQLNRNPSSKSYGSFDRAFWHYRTNDISCARYQEAVYTLTLLYCSDFEGNEYFKDRKILQLIEAVLAFTTKIQRKNGSFDEWYINEGSYVATAFVVAAISQTMQLLKDRGIDIGEKEAVYTMLKEGADFLAKAKENTVMNQVSGAIFAIAAAGKVTGREDLIVTAKDLLKSFLMKQSREGWWSEYGGPDIGYLTLTVSYLGKYQALFPNDATVSAIAKAKSFIEAFINPDLTAGGEHMSRNTEYIIPSPDISYLGSVGPAQLDDRYLCYILYNWFETGLVSEPKTPAFPLSETFYAESGLVRVVNKSYFLVINGKKGGSFRLYAADGVYYDSGVEVKHLPGNLSAGILDTETATRFDKGLLTSAGSMKTIKEPLLVTHLSVVFKAWQFVFGRITFFQKIIKDFLRPRMISNKTGTKVTYKREIQYTDQAITVTDTIQGIDPEDVILVGMKSAYSAVPSSKYVAVADTSNRRLSPRFEEEQIGGVYILKRFFSFK